VLDLDGLTDVLMGRAHEPNLTQASIEANQPRGERLSELFAAARMKRLRGERVVLNTNEVTQ